MPLMGLKLAKMSVNQALDNMGMWSTVQAAFGLHHLGHSHNQQAYGMPVDPAGAETIRNLAKSAPKSLRPPPCRRPRPPSRSSGPTARAWLAERLQPKPPPQEFRWGVGSDSVAVFHNVSQDDMRALVDEGRAGCSREGDRRLPRHHLGPPLRRDGAVAAPTSGPTGRRSRASGDRSSTRRSPSRGPDRADDRDLRHRRAAREVRPGVPALRPAVLPAVQRARRRFRPGRGGDHRRAGGRRVAASTARRCGRPAPASPTMACSWPGPIRTSPSRPGFTMFLVPMDAPGVEVRPIRQMSGPRRSTRSSCPTSASATTMRRRRPWATAGRWRTRRWASSARQRPGSASQGRHLRGPARAGPPAGQDRRSRGAAAAGRRLRANPAADGHHRSGRPCGRGRHPPGPAASIGKIVASQNLTRIGDIAASLLGARIAADTGEPDAFAWTEHVLGAPGYRLAGGTDEIQRNIIGERVLGLPREPRVDRGVPWNQIPGNRHGKSQRGVRATYTFASGERVVASRR